MFSDTETTTGPVPEPLVIVGCGTLKRPERSPAGLLYTGSLFCSAMRAAEALAPRASILILSALHGLLGLDDPTDPYDMRMGAPGSVSAEQVAEQARRRELLGHPVIALCGRAYADVIRAVWPVVATPIYGLPIGKARHELAVIVQECGR